MDWLLSGASRQELYLVAFIGGLVLLAPRVPRWGGAIGAWLGRGDRTGGSNR